MDEHLHMGAHDLNERGGLLVLMLIVARCEPPHTYGETKPGVADIIVLSGGHTMQNAV